VTRPRFVKAIPADGELSRWTVQVGQHSPGVVVSKPWGHTVIWSAYLDGDPRRPVRITDPRSRGKAANALLLAAEQPDQLPSEKRSRARHPSGGGPQ
jgi:hypothetical protein